MKFIKSDDQTLSTIARIATVEPQIARDLAMKSKYYDKFVKDETLLFWKQLDSSISMEELKEAVRNGKQASTRMADKLRHSLEL